jgi:hypothetical protein
VAKGVIGLAPDDGLESINGFRIAEKLNPRTLSRGESIQTPNQIAEVDGAAHPSLVVDQLDAKGQFVYGG